MLALSDSRREKCEKMKEQTHWGKQYQKQKKLIRQTYGGTEGVKKYKLET